MSPTAAEIETIVRRVLSTLTDRDAPLSGNAISSPADQLSIDDRVVSLQSIKNRLGGFRKLQIGKSAVLTPAAKDYCREVHVEVVRGEVIVSPKTDSKVSVAQTESTTAKVVRPQRLIVAGSAKWMGSIGKQLCPKQANVIDTLADDNSAMRAIAEGLRSGHQAALAIVDGPHASCWQAARDDRVRPAVVSNWGDLNDVLREVPVNLLILSSKTWNVPSVCNVARRFFQHLQTQS